jgi:RND family efflux transporter MFP subunit
MISLLRWGAGAVSLAALGACSAAQSAETGDQPEAPPVVVRVEPVVSIVRPDVVTASGVVEARSTVDIAFQVPGKVVAVGPDEGDVVREGRLLAALDPTDYRLVAEQNAALDEHAAAERDRYRPLLAAGSVAPNDLERMESAARQSAAAAALARKRLADTRLLAPISGVVARRAIERGSTVTAGQGVFTLVDLDVVKVRIGVPEADIDILRPGQAATIRLPALEKASFAGRVSSVGVTADPTTRTYAVEISVPNPAHRLKAGMVAEATVEGGRRKTALTVPVTAAVRDAQGATVVYVLDQGTMRVHGRQVTLGAALGQAVEVTKGLTHGELVVVAGQQRMREGSLVTTSAVVAAESAR